MSKANDLANRTLELARTFDAPLELVWEAWTQPEHLARWWGPPGMVVEVAKHDFRVGGEWRYVMPMPNGDQFISAGVYAEIVPLAKIVTSADFRPMTEGVELHMLFKGDGEKTHFTFLCIHETEEYCRQQERMGFYNGWGSAFDRLDSHIKALV